MRFRWIQGVGTVVLAFVVGIGPYSTHAAGLDPVAIWSAQGDQTDSSFGISAVGAGDVNGDGLVDVFIGSDGYSNGQALEGRVLLYYGTPTGIAVSPGWTVEGNQAEANFGHRVAAGDFNGDDHADLAVGSYFHDDGEMDEGAVFVFYGSPTGPGATADWSADGDQAFARFGTSVAAVDVDADGYDDLFVGAPLFANGQNEEGRVFMFSGSATGLSATPSWTAEVNQISAFLGFPVGSAGDVNGDGYGDVVVGAIFSDFPMTNAGAAYLYLGSATGPSTTFDWHVTGSQAFELLGHGARGAGDVNGDGYDDVVLGGPNFTSSFAGEGRAMLYTGSPAGLSTSPIWTVYGGQAGAFFGFPTGGAGDVNGDGYADLVVGCIYCDEGETDEGHAVVFLGSATGPAAAPSQVLQPDDVLAEMGFSVARAGDVTDDGVDDLIVGARAFTDDQVREGAVFVYGGIAAGTGRPSTPLLVGKPAAGTAEIVWGASCRATDDDYVVYRGDLGDFASHQPLTCSTGGQTNWITPVDGTDQYFLVAPTNGTHQGSLGRPPVAGACAPDLVTECPGP